GESNATIARRLGIDLTTVAHHLALLELPPPLEAALRTGRCAAARTLYELNKVHAQRPEAVVKLLRSEVPITREAVAALRKPTLGLLSSARVGLSNRRWLQCEE
ncbi:MAG: hypothetical protein OEW27_18095, partial [Aquincola sp.]|nr:hypothetical protein [Aquincola sp.]